jgi:hypothetical protein
MNVSVLQASFAGGEIDPQMQYKVDQARRASSVAAARNFYVDKTAALCTRPGQFAMARAKYADKKCKIIPFIFSREQAYVIEAGEGYMRLHTREGTVIDGEGEIYEIFTQYAEQDLFNIRYQQSADVMYMVDGVRNPSILTRYSHTDWRTKNYIEKNGPFLPRNTDATIKLGLNTPETPTETNATSIVLGNYFSGYLTATAYASDFNVSLDGIVIYSLSQSNAVVQTYFQTFNSVLPSGISLSWETGNYGGNPNAIRTIVFSGPASLNGRTIKISWHQSYGNLGTINFPNEFSGGTVTGDNNTSTTLSSTKDIFSLSHIGTLFKIDKQMPEQKIDATISGNTITSSLYCKNDWRLVTQGIWAGEITIQTSKDGIDWEDYRTTKSPSTSSPFNENIRGDIESDDIVRVRLNITGFSGSCNLLFSIDPFIASTVCRVIDFIDGKNVTVEIEHNNTGNISPTTEWAEGAFSNQRGWPAQIAMHDERLAFGHTRNNPGGVWLGETGIPDSFKTNSPVLATDAIPINVWGRNKSSVVSVNGLVSMGDLIIFTDDGIFKMTSTGITAPDTIAVRPAPADGSNGTAPVTTGNSVLFASALSTQVKALFYALEIENFRAADKSAWTTHLLKTRKIVSMAHQREPHGIVWIVLDAGKLLSFTYIEEQNIEGWALHETDGEYEDVCTIPGDHCDEVWFVVKRGDKRFIERGAPMNGNKDIKEKVCVDCAMTHRSAAGEAPVDAIIGLGHLEGKTVTGIADGFEITPRQVINGQITLDSPASIAHVGLPYKCFVEGLDINLNLQNGPTIGRKARSVSAKVMLADTCGGLIGADNNREFLSRVPSGAKDGVPALESGLFEITLQSEWGNAKFYFEQDKPYPATLTGVIVDVEYGG